MALTSGTKLGPYQIQSPLGAGGMGEVYRARDSRLGRDVAIKVLPEAFAKDAERMARLAREAQVLASLNHPNIAAIYGFEDSSGHALVMELVDGQTLADCIARSPIPLSEALLLAKQICEALEYAHERGIVHRDLKPANVKITPDGVVKLLDFGLAKAFEGQGSSTDIASSPTLTHMATQAGIILGTAAYMSPEQAKGRNIDRRADIWAFGCVLYEMLTGKMAFGGETVTDTLAEIIKSDPDWSLLPPGTPASLRKLLQRCLKKDAKQRLQAIGDARIAIEEQIAGADSETDHASPAAAPAPMWRRTLPWAVAFATCALLAGVIVWTAAFRSSRAPAMHFRAVTNFAGVQSDPALSPDGRSVAFVSNRDGHYNLYIGLINGGNLVKLTDDANLKIRPSWSPDGGEIAYARLNDSGIWDIWKIPALGGTPLRIVLNAIYPSWSHDGHLAYMNSVTGAIWISDASGQNARELATTRSAGNPNTEPRFSPDGRQIAFSMELGGSPYHYLKVVDVNSGKVRQLTNDWAMVLSPAWSADGRFIYFASSRMGTLNVWKIAQSGGEPEQITAGQGDDAQLDVSANGKQIVFSNFHTNINLFQLDLDASAPQHPKLLTNDPARNQGFPSYSPDGKHIAYFSYLKGTEREGIWLANADGSNAVQLVQDNRTNVFPRWTPDSESLVYSSFSMPASEYRRVSISGGAPQTLPNQLTDAFPDVGSDGNLLYQGPRHQVQTFNSGKSQTLFTLSSEENSFLFRWSPDSHSVAYIVNPSQENDSREGLWLSDLKTPPRQIFHGWVLWYARGPKNQIYFLEGKPDLNGVFWKIGWHGQGLVRLPLTIPLGFGYDTVFPYAGFDISPDGRHLAFTGEGVQQANIGMLENIR